MRTKIHLLMLFSLVMLSANAAYPIETDAKEGGGQQRPINYGLVVDNTNPFRHMLEIAIQVSKEIVSGNGESDEAFAVRFVDQENISIIQELTSQESDLLDAIDNMYIESGSSAIFDAVYVAAEYLAEHRGAGQPSRRGGALVIITAGANENSYYRIEQVLSLVHASRIKLYVIGFPEALSPDGANATRAAEKLLKRLATESGGLAYFPASHAEAIRAARNISEEMRKQ